MLTAEKDEWENAVAGGVEAMQADAEALKTETNVVTDNIYILEAYLLRLAGGDKDALESIRREFYGGLYCTLKEKGWQILRDYSGISPDLGPTETQVKSWPCEVERLALIFAGGCARQAAADLHGD